MDVAQSVPDISDSISTSSTLKRAWKWSAIHPIMHSDPEFKVYGWTNNHDQDSIIPDNTIQPRDDITLQTYTTDEYEQMSRDEDNQDTSWSKIETDYFLKLAKDCQLNFIIMADRYQFGVPGTDTGKNRTVPELRARYNQLCKKLPRYQHLHDPYYSKEVDEARREWMNQLSKTRTNESIQQEKKCLHYLEDFLKNGYSDLLQQREQIINIFSGDVLAFIDGISQTTTCLNTNIKPEPIITTEATIKKPSKRSSQSSESRSAISSPSVPKKSSIGPILRSSKIKPVRSGLVKHVEKIILDLGLLIRPCMPTASICEQYDEIRSMVSKLIDSRRATERLENELGFIKNAADNKRKSFGTSQDDGYTEMTDPRWNQTENNIHDIDTTPTKRQKNV